MRKGSIYLKGLPGDRDLFLPFMGGDGPHIMKTVGQLDKDDPDVLRHDHKHFSQVFGLIVFKCLKRKFAKFGYPVYKGDNALSEFITKLFSSHLCIFKDIVQQRSDYRLTVDLHPCQYRCNRYGVYDIGITTVPHLTPM